MILPPSTLMPTIETFTGIEISVDTRVHQKVYYIDVILFNNKYTIQRCMEDYEKGIPLDQEQLDDLNRVQQFIKCYYDNLNKSNMYQILEDPNQDYEDMKSNLDYARKKKAEGLAACTKIDAMLKDNNQTIDSSINSKTEQSVNEQKD